MAIFKSTIEKSIDKARERVDVLISNDPDPRLREAYDHLTKAGELIDSYYKDPLHPVTNPDFVAGHDDVVQVKLSTERLTREDHLGIRGSITKADEGATIPASVLGACYRQVMSYPLVRHPLGSGDDD